jgi:hypothetical protein
LLQRELAENYRTSWDPHHESSPSLRGHTDTASLLLPITGDLSNLHFNSPSPPGPLTYPAEPCVFSLCECPDSSSSFFCTHTHTRMCPLGSPADEFFQLEKSLPGQKDIPVCMAACSSANTHNKAHLQPVPLALLPARAHPHPLTIRRKLCTWFWIGSVRMKTRMLSPSACAHDLEFTRRSFPSSCMPSACAATRQLWQNSWRKDTQGRPACSKGIASEIARRCALQGEQRALITFIQSCFAVAKRLFGGFFDTNMSQSNHVAVLCLTSIRVLENALQDARHAKSERQQHAAHGGSPSEHMSASVDQKDLDTMLLPMMAQLADMRAQADSLQGERSMLCQRLLEAQVCVCVCVSVLFACVFVCVYCERSDAAGMQAYVGV